LKKPATVRLLRRRPVVLTAIDFDNQACIVANKIGNITPEWHLPAESVPVDAT
jgi:hypothetical protein